MYLDAMRWLPGASPAHTAALANVLVAICALAVLLRACEAWGASRASSALVCLVWALAPTTWALATSAEVFAMNALFAAGILLMGAPEPPGRPEVRGPVLGLLAGLGLANQYTLVCAAPLGLYAFWRAIAASPRRALVLAISAFAFAFGLLPYAFLFTTARRALDPASWSWGAVRSPGDLFAYLARADYPSSALNSPDHPWAQLVRISAGLAGLPLVASLGVASWLVRRRGTSPQRERLLQWGALAASLLCAGPAFMTIFDVPLEDVGAAVTERFDLLPMTLFVPIAARALDELSVARLLPSALAALAALAAAFVALTFRGLPRLHAHQRLGVEIYAENAFAAAPAGSIIVGDEDSRLGSFLYARFARGERPDVTFVNPRLLFTTWYRARIETALGLKLPPVRADALDVNALFQGLLATGRPVFVTDWFSPKVFGRLPSYPVGPLVRFVASRSEVPPPEVVEAQNIEASARFVREPLPLPGPEPWNDALVQDYIRPWDALAGLFAKRGDIDRAAVDARRAADERQYRWP
jgi:hypothetical protein